MNDKTILNKLVEDIKNLSIGIDITSMYGGFSITISGLEIGFINTFVTNMETDGNYTHWFPMELKRPKYYYLADETNDKKMFNLDFYHNGYCISVSDYKGIKIYFDPVKVDISYNINEIRQDLLYLIDVAKKMFLDIEKAVIKNENIQSV